MTNPDQADACLIFLLWNDMGVSGYVALQIRTCRMFTWVIVYLLWYQVRQIMTVSSHKNLCLSTSPE
jgi:hypothetical protein